MSEYPAMPRAVRSARMLMWVQVAVGFLGLLLLFVFVRTEQNVGGSAATWGLVFLAGGAQVGFLVFLAANMGWPRPWLRWAGIGIEAVMIPLFLLDLLAGEMPSLVGLFLTATVMVQLAKDEARDWFAVNAAGDRRKRGGGGGSD